MGSNQASGFLYIITIIISFRQKKEQWKKKTKTTNKQKWTKKKTFFFHSFDLVKIRSNRKDSSIKI